jgi:cysteine sulfinate desulfinase/cysteine desulfurase-like protein
VLKAMDLNKIEAEGALRFSFSVMNEPAEIAYAVKELLGVVHRLKKMVKH